MAHAHDLGRTKTEQARCRRRALRPLISATRLLAVMATYAEVTSPKHNKRSDLTKNNR